MKRTFILEAGWSSRLLSGTQWKALVTKTDEWSLLIPKMSFYSWRDYRWQRFIYFTFDFTWTDTTHCMYSSASYISFPSINHPRQLLDFLTRGFGCWLKNFCLQEKSKKILRGVSLWADSLSVAGGRMASDTWPGPMRVDPATLRQSVTNGLLNAPVWDMAKCWSSRFAIEFWDNCT